MKRCKDCAAEGITTNRPATYPGPRCATHHRSVKKTRSKSAHDKRVQSVYTLPPNMYDVLYEAQGGTCAICHIATGARKRLSVDHDHACCPGPESCGKCVRGLLCTNCNRNVLGYLREDIDALTRAIEYLRRPPAQAVLIGLED